MPPTTRASARRASGAPTPPRPTPYWQESQPPRRALSTILGGTMGSPVAASSNRHTGITTCASARQASAASQFAAADDSSRQVQASTVPRSLVLGGTISLTTAVVPASQPVNTFTRVSSQGASDVGQSVIVIDSSPPPPAPYPSLGRTVGPESSHGSGSPSSQPISSSRPHPQLINSSQVRSAISNRLLIIPTSSWANQTFTSPTLRTVIDSINSTFSPISSSNPVGSPERRVLSETTRQENTDFPKPEQITLTTNDTFNKDLNDPYTPNLVGLLQQSHPWAPAKLCHSMLVGCGYHEDADHALRMLTIEILDDDHEYDNDGKARAKGEVSAESPFNGSFDGYNLPTMSSSFPSQSSSIKAHALEIASSSKKNGRKSHAEANIESGHQIISFSKRNKSSPGIFSRAERQRVIAGSNETTADRERASFVAKAVLYRAFSYTDFPQHEHLYKYYYPRYGFLSFPMAPGPFKLSSPVSPPSKNLFKGTDRGKFQPLSFDTPTDGRVVLRSISLAFPYLKTSFEELRFGDYIRGRKKAPHLFDLFRKLPPEIRCMIWRFAMPPRTVELRHNYRIDKCWALAKVPVTLHVCRESRYEALKVYSLAFGIRTTPNKTYFDFKRDTLFLTFEKWYDDGEYADEINRITYHFDQSQDAKKIRHLAIDQDLVEIFAQRLEEEEEEWYDEGDEDMPEPELEVIPIYTSLQSLVIVKTTIDGFWYHEDCDECDECAEKDCHVKKRMKRNDEAVILPTRPFNVANKIQQQYYKQMVAKIKLQNSDWSVPELEYMLKRTRPKAAKPVSKTGLASCNCGGCHSDSD